MAPARSLATVCTTDQWLRCSHQDTALDQGEGTVSLAWQQPVRGHLDRVGRQRPGRPGLRPGRLPLPRRPADRAGAVDRLAARRPALAAWRAALARRPARRPGHAVVRPVRGGVGPAPPGPGPVVDRGRSRPAPVRPGRRDRHDLGLRPRRPCRVPTRLVRRSRHRPGRRGRRRTRRGRGPRPAAVTGSRRAANRSRSRCPPPRWRASTRTRSRSRSRTAPPARSGCCGGRPPARAGRYRPRGRPPPARPRRRSARSRGPAASRSTAKATW